MDIIQAIVLAIVQGLTEFLPISSSAHLLLVPVFTAWDDQGLAFDVAVHLGSLAAVILYFRREIADMWSAWWRSVIERRIQDPDAKLAWAVILGTIPVCVVALLIKDLVADAFRSPVVVAFGLIVFGILLGWADWRKHGQRTEYQMRARDVAVIAFAQALALIPGTSRSGITITAALFMGLNREAAARFSFLLSIPVIALAGAFETRGMIVEGVGVDWLAVTIGTVLSGLSAYLCIHYFLAFIKRIGMQPFVAYRIALGILLLVLFW
ncbi:undecaprenyl-diphosphate phosphatase [Marinimicrobium alkaliphilum]|uniref:undecaprenyl-diphosphate phosphatase n=1 Tax=Marinimicrobium alkaliphilum TaxID=2202654 RepID=UPI000DBA50B7|nr:undecaprenyl-diphosphate phosphatase [Marinimicrobium alkaliphilum]